MDERVDLLEIAVPQRGRRIRVEAATVTGEAKLLEQGRLPELRRAGRVIVHVSLRQLQGSRQTSFQILGAGPAPVLCPQVERDEVDVRALVIPDDVRARVERRSRLTLAPRRDQLTRCQRLDEPRGLVNPGMK